MKSILITGGAGFVGCYLARLFRRDFPQARIVALDNLYRRGSEINIGILQSQRIEFVHGDVRTPSDLNSLKGNFDLLIEASADPTVSAGIDGDPDYIIETNLYGAINCLNWARRRAGATVFLSTSRAHSLEALNQIRLDELPTRFDIAEKQELPGISKTGIAENFPTGGARSFYGASKLAAEMMIEEYVSAYGMNVVTNRCSVICGAGQFGKASQGIFTLWVANHLFGRPLRYTGYGGTGKQVRDLLHPKDLYLLIKKQLGEIESVSGQSFNIGGGRENSISMQEFTDLCREVTDRETEIVYDQATTTVDVPLFIADSSRAKEKFDWKPEVDLRSIVEEVAEWLGDSEKLLREVIR